MIYIIKIIFQILQMVKVSIYINKHLQFLVKTNMDLQERQEEALDSKDKTKNIKEKNSEEKKR